MPHDANGKLLEVGDKVNIPGTITNIGSDGPYCNVNVELDYSMPAYPDQKTNIGAINASQVVKVE